MNVPSKSKKQKKVFKFLSGYEETPLFLPAGRTGGMRTRHSRNKTLAHRFARTDPRKFSFNVFGGGGGKGAQ